MNSFRIESETRRGGVLIMALIVLMVVGAMATAFMQLNASATRRQALAIDNKLSFYVAEAGLSESFVSLLDGKTGEIGSAAEPARFGDGLVWVERTETEGTHVRLDATGTCARGMAKLSMVVERGYVNPAKFGVFTRQDLLIPAGTTIDGYDSSAEPVLEGDPVPDVPAQVGSNGIITIQSTPRQPTYVGGSISTGPGGGVTLEGDPTVTGEELTMGVDLGFPELEIPVVSQVEDFESRRGVPIVIDPGTYGYMNVSVSAGSSIILIGPLDLVVDTLQLSAQASLVVDDRGGKVQVFVRESVTFEEGSSFEQLEGATDRFQLVIEGVGTSTLHAGGAMYGFVYAPNGEIDLGAGLEHSGALVANLLTLEPGATLHFDQALADSAAAASLPQLVSWRLLELSDVRATESDLEPNVDRSTLEPLSRASGDPIIAMKYDLEGGPKGELYTGARSNFSFWAQIKEVKTYEADGVEFGKKELDALNKAIGDQIQAAKDGQDKLDGEVANETAESEDVKKTKKTKK